MKIQKIMYPIRPDKLEDVYDDILDVWIILEDDKYCTDGFTYVVEVATPQGLSSWMKEDNLHYLSPTELIVIVDKLTEEVIEEAIQALVEARENAYWLKLYHAASELDINHLNAAMEKLKKLFVE